ncbi:MAG TPA: hypothetical protein VNM15_05320 [Candidatus Binatia bacterium]|nr:hypothetical protein [Candidatus Binatia bacterium]
MEELQQKAGPRGFTFAGRVAQPGESIEGILGRLPVAELETAGLFNTAGYMTGRSTRATILRHAKVIREIGKLPQDEESRAERRAQIAEDIAPLTQFLQMLRESPIAGIINLFDRNR